MKTKDTAAPAAEALDEIIDSARLLAQWRAGMAELVGTLNAGIESLKADALPELRAAIDAAASEWQHLEQLLRAHPELFQRPRSLEAHGIKFGWQKGKGSLGITDPDRTVRLIRKHLPDQADVLIATKEVPAKDALAQLSAADLKRLGVEVKDAGDQVFIKPVETGVDKLVKALVSAKVEGE
jgi:hypothetical protein